MFASLILFGLMAGCGGSEPKIDGKWKIQSAIGDGKEMSDGQDWFDFKTGGEAVVRFGKTEEIGTWNAEPGTSTLVVKSQGGNETSYDYRISGDSLFLNTVIGKSHRLGFICTRMP